MDDLTADEVRRLRDNAYIRASIGSTNPSELIALADSWLAKDAENERLRAALKSAIDIVDAADDVDILALDALDAMLAALADGEATG